MKIQLTVIAIALFASSSQYEVTQNIQISPHQQSSYASPPLPNNQGKKLEFTPDLSHFRGMYPKATLQDLGEVSHDQQDSGKVIKVTRTYAIKVPVPYPVKIQKNVPYPVPVPKPYPVHVTKIVKVSQPVPVEVPIPVKVPVENYHHDIKSSGYTEQASSSYGYIPSQSYQSQEETSGHYDSNAAPAMFYSQLNANPHQVAYVMPTEAFNNQKAYEDNNYNNGQVNSYSNGQVQEFQGLQQDSQMSHQLQGMDLYNILSQIQQLSKDSQGEYSMFAMKNYSKRHNKNNEVKN